MIVPVYCMCIDKVNSSRHYVTTDFQHSSLGKKVLPANTSFIIILINGTLLAL